MSVHHHAHDHDHAHGSGNKTAVAIAAVLTGGFMLVEVAGGLVSGSLALLADAGHMLTDFAALFMAWWAFHLSERPADTKRTYGFDRFSVLAAFVNGLALFAIAAWICWEAVLRLNHPHEVSGGIMMWIAIAGLIVNVVAFWVLSRGEGENLNVEAAALHVMGDLLGSVAALVASLVIIWTSWTPIDPILSVLVALIILRSAWKVVKRSGHILLEGAPPDFDSKAVATTLVNEIEGVEHVDHIHAWSITQERPMATLEARISTGTNAVQASSAIKKLMHDRFGIDHVTVEIDYAAAQAD